MGNKVIKYLAELKQLKNYEIILLRSCSYPLAFKRIKVLFKEIKEIDEIIEVIE